MTSRRTVASHNRRDDTTQQQQSRESFEDTLKAIKALQGYLSDIEKHGQHLTYQKTLLHLRHLEKEERKLAEEAGVDMSKYILKSEIVPPVCPKCPDSRTCPRQKPAPPCPPCARCPEPAFECKKVPNYSAATNSKLPRPFLNDFSQFT